MHLCLRLANGVDDVALAQRIAQLGMVVRPLSAYCISRSDVKGLVIGYGYASLSEIERLGPRLASTIKNEAARLGL